MLGYSAGFVAFLLLFISKYMLARLLLTKKQVALSLISVVLSELFLILLLYISIDKYKLSGIRIVIGFMMSALVCAVIYGIKGFNRTKDKTRENGKDGKF